MPHQHPSDDIELPPTSREPKERAERSLGEASGTHRRQRPKFAEVASDTGALPELFDAVKEWIRKKGWLPDATLQQLANLSSNVIGNKGSALLTALRERQMLDPDQLSELEEVERLTDTLPNYHLEQRLGAGAVGAVYLATEKESRTLVALKFLHDYMDVMDEHRQRFEREASLLASLNHPVIPRLIDHSRAVERGDLWSGNIYEQPPYLAMEYVSGMTLKELLEKAGGPVPEKFALWACAQVAKGLEHAFTQAGIIHRDIKPDNIILQIGTDVPLSRLYNDTFPIKIIDFGLAKVSTDERSHRGGTSSFHRSFDAGTATESLDKLPQGFGEADGLTMTGAVLGTPRYMAPEQIMGEDVSWEADLYALGATLFHLMTGESPYLGSSPTEVMMAHIQEPVPDPRSRVPSISTRGTNIVMKALEKKTNRRFASYIDFIEACERAISAIESGSSTEMHMLSRPYRRQQSTASIHQQTGTQRRSTSNQHREPSHPPAQAGDGPGTAAYRRQPTQSMQPESETQQSIPTTGFYLAPDAAAPAVALEPVTGATPAGSSVHKRRRSPSSSDATNRLTDAIQHRVRNDITKADIPSLDKARTHYQEATRQLLKPRRDERKSLAQGPLLMLILAALLCAAIFAWQFLEF